MVCAPTAAQVIGESVKAATASITFLLSLLLLALGLYIGGHPGLLPPGLRDIFVDDSVSLQSEAGEIIERNYFKSVDGKRLTSRSIEGMVDSLDDRFSHYLDPKSFDLLTDNLSGHYGGVGISIRWERRGLRVARVFKGSPAAAAGIKRGDLVTVVDGRPIEGEPSDLASARIRGRPGTVVRLTVEKSSGKKERLKMHRKELQLPLASGSSKSFRRAKLGVVGLSQFAMGASDEVADQVKKLKGKGVRGLVLDLRGNHGGLISEAVSVTSLFIDHGLVVTTRGRASPEKSFDATGRPLLPKMPLVVLVDRYSASASEIVAGALQDHERARVVGQKTFGKGVFQQPFPLQNGGAIYLTVGHYYTPKGHDLGGKGVVPSAHALDSPKSKKDEGLNRALSVLAAEAR